MLERQQQVCGAQVCKGSAPTHKVRRERENHLGAFSYTKNFGFDSGYQKASGDSEKWRNRFVRKGHLKETSERSSGRDSPVGNKRAMETKEGDISHDVVEQ